MSYQLVLSELINEKTKDVGENIFFNDLPSDYQVYVLYYPGISLNEDLASKLRNLGEIAGRNLLVNIARLDDPNYKKIVKKFGIRTFPTIIVTAIDKLASPPTEYSTAYVKIDNKRLLNSPDLTFECVQKMFNLFIEGKISEAIREKNHKVRMSRIKGIINSALKGIRDYLKKWDVSFSFITGKLELKHRGG
ncbi:MAG: hypothetical protein JSV12_07185 [Candidatus Bathyarchaeota archaeon]|nr:MAG: hypothetical protein JSV12_07185 [Candidatus Bathyarchaeota archaeon]